MGVEGNPLCTACSRAEDDHPFKHPFTPPGEQLKLPDPPKKQAKDSPRVIVGAAPDLILRHVLLRKGIITTEDLQEAERELTLGIKPDGQAAGVSPEQDGSSGDSPDRARSSAE